LNFACVGDKITSIFNSKSYEVSDMGVLHPSARPISEPLSTGQVGYITCGMKDPADGTLDALYY
jgi:translation elongation factor EF-4